MVVGIGRLRAVAVAAEVGGDDGEVTRKPCGDLMPHHVRLRIAVQEKQRRPGATVPKADFCVAGVDGG